MRTLSSKTIYQNSEAHLVLHVVMEDGQLISASHEVHLPDGIYVDKSSAISSFFLLQALEELGRRIGT